VLGATTDTSSTPSSTSGSTAPKYSTASSQLEITAGGDRLTAPGSPINFQATIKKNAVSANDGVKFSWSFGDGGVNAGALVNHMYRYPGDYVVVLNASAGNIFAVTRLKVKVVEPKFSLVAGGDFVQLNNDSDYEINLFNWKIVSGGRGFVFQPDTIILPHSKIKLEKSLLTMKGEETGRTFLKNFLGVEVASIDDPLTTEEVKEASAKISEARNIATVLLSQLQPAQPRVIKAADAPTAVQLAIPTSTPAASTGTIIYEIPKRQTFWATLIDAFAKIFR
jgi:PKD repeat protein